jgi:hypothetical protein
MGGNKVRSELKDTGDAGKKMGSDVEGAGRKMAGAFDGFRSSIRATMADSEKLGAVMEKSRNWGAGLAVAGAAGMALGNSLARAAQEGEKAQKMMEAMLNKRGEGGAIEEMTGWAGKLAEEAALVDDDPLKEAAAGLLGFGLNAKQIQEIMPGLIGQSRLYGQSLESVAVQFGKAFSKGNAQQLAKAGVTLDPKDLDALSKITDHAEKQRRMFELVKGSMERYALSITQGMSEGEIAANRMALQVDNVMTSLGVGASKAKAQLDSMGAKILATIGASEGFNETAGYIEYMGSTALTATGSVLGLASQVGMTALGLKSMGITGVASFTAIRTAAMSAGIAIWAALAPVLPLVLAIAAVMAAITAALVWFQNRKAKQAEEEGDVFLRKNFDMQNESRRKKGQKLLDWETYKGEENADDDSAPPDITSALAKVEAMQKAGPQAMAPAQVMPAVAAAAASPAIATEPVTKSAALIPSLGAMSNQGGQAARIQEAIRKGAKITGNEVYIPDGVLESDSDEDALIRALSKKGSGKAAGARRGGAQEVRAKHKVGQEPNGSYRITFDDIIIPNPLSRGLAVARR